MITQTLGMMLSSCPHSTGAVDSLMCSFACALPIGWQVAKKRKVDTQQQSTSAGGEEEQIFYNTDELIELSGTLEFLLRNKQEQEFKKLLYDNPVLVNFDLHDINPPLVQCLIKASYLTPQNEDYHFFFSMFKWLLSEQVGASPYILFEIEYTRYTPLSFCCVNDIDDLEMFANYLINVVGVDVNEWNAYSSDIITMNEFNRHVSYISPLGVCASSLFGRTKGIIVSLLKRRDIIPFSNGVYFLEIFHKNRAFTHETENAVLEMIDKNYYSNLHLGRWCTKKTLRRLKLIISPQLYRVVEEQARRFWEGLLSGRENYSQLPIAIRLGAFEDDNNLINEMKALVSVIRRRGRNPAMRGFPLEMYNTIMRDVAEISSKFLAI